MDCLENNDVSLQDDNYRCENGLEDIFVPGCKIEAKDFRNDKWWLAKILEVDIDGAEVLVHFIKWNSRHDEWIRMDSPRLRKSTVEINNECLQQKLSSFNPSKTILPSQICINSISQATESISNSRQKLSLRKKAASSSELVSESMASKSVETHQKLLVKNFRIGDKVVAAWGSDDTFYPAKILSRKNRTYYRVEFYDGVKDCVKKSLIRPANFDEISFNGCRSDVYSSNRRERKLKFDVKQLFKVRKSNEASDGFCQRRHSSDEPSPRQTRFCLEEPNFKNFMNKNSILPKNSSFLLSMPSSLNKRLNRPKRLRDKIDFGNSGGKIRRTSSTDSNFIELSADTNLNSATNSPPKNEAHDQFPYRLIDLSLKPEKIAELLVEGVNIPGIMMPIYIDNQGLPSGWRKQVVRRDSHMNTCNWEVNIIDPYNKSFRRRSDLERYIDKKGLSRADYNFDFSLDERLKAIQNIWKQYPIKDTTKINETNTLLTEKEANYSDVIGIKSETGQGVRCPFPGRNGKTCHKLFRTNKLLQMHVKLYHQTKYRRKVRSKSADANTDLTTSLSKTIISSTNVDDQMIPTVVDVDNTVAEPQLLNSTTGSKKISLTLDEYDKSCVLEVYKCEPVLFDGQTQVKEEKIPVSPSYGNTVDLPERLELSSNNGEDEIQSKKECGNSNEFVISSFASHSRNPEEIVNCVCGNREEDGFMIQCDICLCWQHASCLDISITSSSIIPEKHVCYTCQNPFLGRTSARYKYDYDWLNKGVLASIKSPSTCDSNLKQLSNISGDHSNLSCVIHSLKVKLAVVGKSTSNKVFMWSNLWEKAKPSDIASIRVDPATDNTQKSLIEKIRRQIPSVDEYNNDQKDEVAVTATASNHVNVEPSYTSAAKREQVEDSGVSSCATDCSNVGEDVEYLDSSEKKSMVSENLVSQTPTRNVSGDDSFVDLNLIPSLLEVQQFLPSIMNQLGVDPTDMLDESTSEPVGEASANIIDIPEPKRLDRQECRLNLLHHIEDIQNQVESRMKEINDKLNLFECTSVVNSAKTKTALNRLLRDTNTSLKLLDLELNYKD